MKTNKNKKFLFLPKRRDKKNNKEILKTFLVAGLVVSITSGVLSYLDKKMQNNSKEKTNFFEEDPSASSTNLRYTTDEMILKLLGIDSASASTVNYIAENLASAKYSFKVKPGDTFEQVLKFKNIGDYVWRKSGTNQLSLVVSENKNSIFTNSNIISSILNKDVVYKGEIGEFKIKFNTPKSEGLYTEKYSLYVKSFGTYVKNSEVEITIDTRLAKDVLISDSETLVINTSDKKILSKSYKPNDINPELKELQKFLNNNGFIVSASGAGSKGNETDKFGPATVKALAAFQKKYNLKNPGTLTQETISFINEFSSKDSKIVTQQVTSNEELSFEDSQVVSSDKTFNIIDGSTLNSVLEVKPGEKVLISFNKFTKTYTVSKNGLIYVNSSNKLSLKNTDSGTFNFGGVTNSKTLVVLKSAFDIVTSKYNDVVCASVSCAEVDNNTTGETNVNSNTNTNTNNTNSNTNNNSNIIPLYKHSLIASEFKLRVGLVYNIFPATITNNTTFNVTDGNNNLIASVLPNEQIIINYDSSTSLYTVIKNGLLISSSTSFIKLQNINSGVFTIVNMENRPYWNSNINFNSYRGDLEVRYNSTYNKTWIINEIGIEDYLKGLGESSNSSSMEYLRTMAVTARTYAAYHYLDGRKSSAQYFHVFSTTSDQVYDGYNRETRQPNVVQATNDTKGIFITYNNNIIQAFYSANAGGKTRSVSETWGSSDLAYLKPVEDKYTKTDTRYGHGVGMSQVGAMRMIANDNATYNTILTYYYTGVQVQKLY